MTEYLNVESRVYSDLENPQNEYSNLDSDHEENDAPRRGSDDGSQSGRSDHGSAELRNDGDGHHDDDHSVHDREGDQSDREDGHIDRENGQSDRSESHSIHDREGSLHDGEDGLRDQHNGVRDGDDGPRDQANDEYDALEESNVYDELVAQAEAQENIYHSVEQDGKSDDGHSDSEEGHGLKRESVEVPARADVYNETVYEEVGHQSGSEGSEKGEDSRDLEQVANDLCDDLDVGDEHTHEHGHERRGSRDSDEVEKRRSLDGDEGIKRQTSSTAPASSGKFMLRTSRKADALHVVRQIRSSNSAEDNPETDELVTILRSTHHEFADDDNPEEAKQKDKMKSFITSKLIHKFEQGIASEEAFNEIHEDNSIEESSKVSESYNRTTVKTTVVKTTVKTEVTSPVSPKSPGIPKNMPASSSSLSSSSQGHQKTVTYNSQLSNSSMTKSSTAVVNVSRHPSNELPNTPDEAKVPGWKAEIEIRKKTKSHVPTQKLKEPMKMSEVPEWKKQLQEKNKMKKLSSSDEPEITLAKVTTVEMDRLKHEMVINHGGDHRGDTLPEWARLADEKKKSISH